jgi:hypothetical protein
VRLEQKRIDWSWFGDAARWVYGQALGPSAWHDGSLIALLKSGSAQE